MLYFGKSTLFLLTAKTFFGVGCEVRDKLLKIVNSIFSKRGKYLATVGKLQSNNFLRKVIRVSVIIIQAIA